MNHTHDDHFPVGALGHKKQQFRTLEGSQIAEILNRNSCRSILRRLIFERVSIPLGWLWQELG